jgi:4-diphosphocytidyl-2-C-methyl-D-erythritol kinase
MRMNESVRILAPAKVNFHLRVVGKRPDGYHDLVSVMQALELSDELVLERRDSGISLSCDRKDMPQGRDNIIYRAAESYIMETGIDGGVNIRLDKQVPMAAGLGGGSSDAAAALRGMEALYGALPRARLMELALSLGADVPFFLSWPCARAEGVGERLTELPSPDGVWLVLVNPGFAVSTRWVFENLKIELTNNHNNTTLPPFEGRMPGAGFLVSLLHNDLERVTAVRYPEINLMKESLAGAGALGALMSGSGPTVFGIFEDAGAALGAAERLKRPGWTVIATSTISSWPEPVIINGLPV